MAKGSVQQKRAWRLPFYRAAAATGIAAAHGVERPSTKQFKGQVIQHAVAAGAGL
jgi:hypothetical protein